MIGRLLRSRGAKKFGRNRLAMLSLVIIGLYVGLGLFTATANTANELGQRFGLFSLEDRPLLGVMLRSRTSEVVGPREKPGFWGQRDAAQRFDEQLFYLETAERALRAASTAAPENRRAALDEQAIGARRFPDVTVDRLGEMTEAARAAADDVVETRRALQAIDALPKQLGELTPLREAIAAAEAGDNADELLFAREELGFGIEDIADRIETALGETEPPAGSISPDALRELAEALLDAGDEPGGPDLTPLDRVAEGAGLGELRERVDGAIEDKVAALEEKVVALFPEPTGLDDAMHAVKLSLGTDRQGRSILIRSLYSAKIAIQVGVVTAIIAVGIGTLLGAAAAFYGGALDHAANWVYSMVVSVPYLVLLSVLAILFIGVQQVEGTLIPLYTAFGLTFWTGPFRVIRGEVLKIRELEYVQAATAIGFGRVYILVRHIIPNTSHLMFINFSLLFIAAVKGEVILTFLGLGLKEGASWGIMITQSAEQVVNGFFWQIGAATFFMFVLVLAFNVFTDALQDAFDPKHVS
ncbi:MAG: ABC transporter permease subunit [Planctomycetota bacterium]